MELALQEALRITKPGGYLCFTSFIEPTGWFKGTILEPVEKSYWNYFAEKYSLDNLIIEDMIHQGDRYYVCFSKKIDLKSYAKKMLKHFLVENSCL